MKGKCECCKKEVDVVVITKLRDTECHLCQECYDIIKSILNKMAEDWWVK